MQLKSTSNSYCMGNAEGTLHYPPLMLNSSVHRFMSHIMTSNFEFPTPKTQTRHTSPHNQTPFQTRIGDPQSRSNFATSPTITRCIMKSMTLLFQLISTSTFCKSVVFTPPPTDLRSGRKSTIAKNRIGYVTQRLEMNGAHGCVIEMYLIRNRTSLKSPGMEV